MFTDIVGYTALMGNDEKKALNLLHSNRELHKPLIAQFNGTWIKELGDGILVSFQTVTDGVKCAMSIQEACQHIPGLQLRIGIHLGEVVFEDHDVFGDGVNIAARLQALAPIGGIFISEAVFRNIDNQKEIESVFVREEVLKNVKHPVRIYQINETSLSSPGKTSFAPGGKIISSPVTKEKSIAVLPFVNMSNDLEQEYFSDGISEEIINSLVQLSDLRVAGRTSAFSFKGKNDDLRTIGEKLGVSTILEGSVRKSGTRIRVTAQLIEVANGFHLWSQKFDRELVDIFDIQDEISRAIVDQLILELSKSESPSPAKAPTRNMEAYNCFLKGRFNWNLRTADGLKKSIQFYEEAIRLDPGYAQAYAAMSDSYSLLCAYHILSPEDSILKARSIAARAAAINPSLAEAYEAIGHVELLYDWNWDHARKSYRQAIRLNPNFATALQRNALIFALFDQPDDAIAEIMQAVNNDPLSLIINTDVAMIYFIQKNYDLAIEKCLTVLEIDPSFLVALFVIGLAHEQRGEFDKAIDYFQRALDRSPGNSILTGALVHTLGKSGNQGRAETLLAELTNLSTLRFVSPYTLACASLGFNDQNAALDYLEKAVSAHSVWIIHLHLKSDPRLDPVRKDERFPRLLNQMGLV